MAYKGQNAPQLDDDDLTEEQREEDEENSYTVERILDYDLKLFEQQPNTECEKGDEAYDDKFDERLGKKRWRVVYLTKWANWSDQHNSWEPRTMFNWAQANDLWIQEIRNRDPSKIPPDELEIEADKRNQLRLEKAAARRAEKAKPKDLGTRPLFRGTSAGPRAPTASDVTIHPQIRTRRTRNSQLDPAVSGIVDFLKSDNAPASVRRLRYEVPPVDRGSPSESFDQRTDRSGSPPTDRLPTHTREIDRYEDVKPQVSHSPLDRADRLSVDRRSRISPPASASAPEISIEHLPRASGEGGFADSDDEDDLNLLRTTSVAMNESGPADAGPSIPANSPSPPRRDHGRAAPSPSRADTDGACEDSNPGGVVSNATRDTTLRAHEEDLGFADSDDERVDRAQVEPRPRQSDGGFADSDDETRPSQSGSGPVITAKPNSASPTQRSNERSPSVSREVTEPSDLFEKRSSAAIAEDQLQAEPSKKKRKLPANAKDKVSSKNSKRTQEKSKRKLVPKIRDDGEDSTATNASSTNTKQSPPTVEKRKRSSDGDSVESLEPPTKVQKASSKTAAVPSSTKTAKGEAVSSTTNQKNGVQARDIPGKQVKTSDTSKQPSQPKATIISSTAPPSALFTQSIVSLSGLGKIKKLSKDHASNVESPSLGALACDPVVASSIPQMVPIASMSASMAAQRSLPETSRWPSDPPGAAPVKSLTLGPPRVPSLAPMPAPTRDPRRRPSADPLPPPPGDTISGRPVLSSENTNVRWPIKDGRLVFDTPTLESRVKAGGFLKRKGVPGDGTKTITSRIREHWRVGQKAHSLFFFDRVLQTGPLNRPRECFIFAPVAKEQSTSKRSRHAFEDCVALQLVLASIEGVVVTDSLRDTCGAIFVHVTELDDSCRWPNDHPSELEQLRSLTIGEVIFIVFGDRDEPDYLDIARIQAPAPPRKDPKMREIWHTTAAVTFTPRAWKAAPERCVRFAGKCKRSMRSWKKGRDVFPWIHASLLLPDGPFDLAEAVDSAHWLLHEALREGSMALTQTTPGLRFGPHLDHSFPTGDDVQVFSAEDMERTASFFPRSAYTRTVKEAQELSALYKTRYLHIRRWIVVGTSDEVQDAAPVPGVDVFTLDKADAEIFKPIYRPSEGYVA